MDLKLRRLTTVALMLPLPALAALVLLRQQAFEAWEDRWAARGSTAESAAAGELSAEAFARGQAVASLTVHPATLGGGASSTVTVTLRYPARAGGSVVRISSADAKRARAPESVTIPAGARSASFKVETSAVEKFTTVGLSVSHEGRTESDTLTLLAPPRREWYAAPTGGAKGQGTKDAPWDLKTTLAGGPQGDAIKPGDTVWLRGGRYEGAFTSTLAGAQDAPVIVRAMPGERVVLDRAGVSESKQPALKVRGAWVWFWGLELTNSNADRRRHSPFDGTDEPWRGSGADVYAPHVKFVNCVFHDNGHGVWDKQDMTEVHGSLFYFNGNNKREHAVYTGNTEGTKYLTDNVVFAQGGYGILAHSNSAKSAQRGLHIEGNVCFDNGAITADDQTTGNLQVGGVGGVPAERVVVRNNFVYVSPAASPAKSNGVRLGYEDKNNSDVRLLDNYVVGRAALRVWWWRSVECAGNTIFSDGEACELLTPAGAQPTGYVWDFNAYFGASGRGDPSFVNNSKTYSFARWRERSGLDAHSRFTEVPADASDSLRVFVRPNRYEAGRAHIIVFNWAGRERAEVDLGGLLANGQRFEIKDAQNYFDPPVASGRYDGKPVALPLKLTEIATPVGRTEKTPSHTGPEFGVFVIIADKS